MIRSARGAGFNHFGGALCFKGFGGFGGGFDSGAGGYFGGFRLDFGGGRGQFFGGQSRGGVGGGGFGGFGGFGFRFGGFGGGGQSGGGGFTCKAAGGFSGAAGFRFGGGQSGGGFGGAVVFFGIFAPSQADFLRFRLNTGGVYFRRSDGYAHSGGGGFCAKTAAAVLQIGVLFGGQLQGGFKLCKAVNICRFDRGGFAVKVNR